MNIDKNTPAFPSDNFGSKAEPGMTLAAYAAIHLRVPDSGIDWLDAMIEKANNPSVWELEQSESKWIPWNGGECPVDGEEFVTIKCRDGETGTAMAKFWDWMHNHADPCGEIIAYRIGGGK